MQHTTIRSLTQNSEDGYNIEVDIKLEDMPSTVSKMGTVDDTSVVSVVLSDDKYSTLIKTSSKNITEVINKLLCNETDSQKPVYKQTKIIVPVKRKNKSKAGEEFSNSQVQSLEINGRLLERVTRQKQVKKELFSHVVDEETRRKIPNTILGESNSTRFYKWLRENKSMIPVKFKITLRIYNDPKEKTTRKIVIIEN